MAEKKWALLVVVSLVAVIVLAGVAGSAEGPSAGQGADPDPTIEERVTSEQAQVVLELPRTLRERYPDAYGGVVAESESRWVILVVDGAPGADRLRADVAMVEAESLERAGRTIDVGFRTVEVPMSRLEEVNAELSLLIVNAEDRATYGLTGVGMDGVGLTVTADAGRESEALGLLQRWYPDVRFSMETTSPATRTTATGSADVAARNGAG